MKSVNVLFIQDSTPCIRNIKYAEALQQQGVNVHLLHKNKSPDEAYGRGNSFYASISIFKNRFFFLKRLSKLIEKYQIDLIHYHNQPDILGARIIKARLGIPFVYDCHDFMSFKHRLSGSEKEAERTCNEESSAIVYPAESYLREASKYYNMVSMQLVYGNYYPASLLLDPKKFLPKHSHRDGLTHLVYQRRLAEKKSDHRYIVDGLKAFDPLRFRIHIFPSNRKEFDAYRSIKSVVMYDKVTYAKLISELSAMDYGLVMFQDSIAHKLPAVRFAFGNKTFDYLCAGLPVLTQDSLDEIKAFVKTNQIGWSLVDINSLPHPQSIEYKDMVNRVVTMREEYSMERQISRILKLYEELIDGIHT